MESIALLGTTGEIQTHIVRFRRAVPYSVRLQWCWCKYPESNRDESNSADFKSAAATDYAILAFVVGRGGGI